MNSRADLDVWHLADLDEEFTVDSKVETFEDYLALEDRLFRQLDELVYAKAPPKQRHAINRYNRGSLVDPEGWSPNWNRSFTLPKENPGAAVLLLHGMSDSPYSLRNLGQRLNAAGAYVLGLRVPGHGTAPSGLVEVTWQDMAAAVRLAMRHLAQLRIVQSKLVDLPFAVRVERRERDLLGVKVKIDVSAEYIPGGLVDRLESGRRVANSGRDDRVIQVILNARVSDVVVGQPGEDPLNAFYEQQFFEIDERIGEQSRSSESEVRPVAFQCCFLSSHHPV